MKSNQKSIETLYFAEHQVSATRLLFRQRLKLFAEIQRNGLKFERKERRVYYRILHSIDFNHWTE